MPIRLKFWLFRHYSWLIPVAFVTITFLVTCFGPGWDIKTQVTVLGLFLSLLYFVPKQQLEEMKLCREIFAECNARYDKLNEKLNTIVDGRPETQLKRTELDTLMDYFNLCGEEHLYFQQGYVLPEVWNSWLNGMDTYLENPRIAAVWNEEKKSDSYYGLQLKKRRLRSLPQTRPTPVSSANRTQDEVDLHCYDLSK